MKLTRTLATSALLLLGSGLAVAQQPAKPPATKVPGKPGAPSVSTATPPGTPWDSATPAQLGEATKAYTAAKTLEGQKKYELALGEYQRSYGIVASPNSHYLVVQMMLKVAAAKREPALLVDAHREAVITLAEATAAAAVNKEKYGKTAQNAALDVEELEKQVPLVIVQVPASVGDGNVTVGGASVPRARWGKPVAVQAGTVEVALELAGGLRSTKTVEAKPGARVEASLTDPTPPKVAAPEPVTPPAELPPVEASTSEGGDSADSEPITESGRGAFVVGAKFGALASLDGLDPHVTGAVQVGYVLPWLHEAIGVMVDVGYAQPVTKEIEGDPRVEGGRYTWHLVEQQLTIQPSLYYRATMLPKMGPGRFIPYLGAGPRIFLTRSRTDSAGAQPPLLEQSEESLEVGVGGHLGTEYTLGPGSLLVEGLFGWTAIDQRTTGDAALTAVSAWAGYRFML